MATSTRASRALLFMRQCRPSPTQQFRHSSSSPYAPSNFNRPSPSTSRSNPSSSSYENSSPFPPSSSVPSPRPFYAHPKSRSPPPPTELSGTRLTFSSWLLSLIGIPPKPPATYIPAPFRIANNPYRARKKWPPDFRDLDSKQQFHFEKTYRRRAALKWARPKWNKGIKLLQQTLITFTIVYFVFICEPGHGMGTPFDGFRLWFFDKLGKLGQLPESSREEVGRLSQEARQRMKKPDADTSPTASS